MLVPVHLTVDQMTDIDPVEYSITFESRPYKQYWTISLIGEKQAFLVDSSGKAVRFLSESEAKSYCLLNWPDLKMI